MPYKDPNYQKKYKLSHKKKLEQYLYQYRKNHKKQIQTQRKIYAIKNKEKIKLYNKKYRQENKEKVKKQLREYIKNRCKIDINFKLAKNLRHRIYKSLKGINKSQITLKLLGCSLDFFRLYLQNKFQPEMSFSNYGKWHVDHIIPCASFDLSKPKEQKKCFNYKNLQPLWAKDNLEKH